MYFTIVDPNSVVKVVIKHVPNYSKEAKKQVKQI